MSSRVLPSGGSTGGGPRGAPKSIDKPNVNAKFSKRPPSRVNDSTVFNAAAPQLTPRSGRRSLTPTPDASRAVRSEGVRVTHHEQRMMEAARFREDHPRQYRKSVERATSPSGSWIGGSVPAADVASPASAAPSVAEPFITANGLHVSGGKLQSAERRKNATSVERVDERCASPATGGVPITGMKPYHQMERFRLSPKLNLQEVKVMNTKPLSDAEARSAIPQQRFAATPRGPHGSLVGVFGPDPTHRAPPAYRPVAPFHQD